MTTIRSRRLVGRMAAAAGVCLLAGVAQAGQGSVTISHMGLQFDGTAERENDFAVSVSGGKLTSQSNTCFVAPVKLPIGAKPAVFRLWVSGLSAFGGLKKLDLSTGESKELAFAIDDAKTERRQIIARPPSDTAAADSRSVFSMFVCLNQASFSGARVDYVTD